ncbi:2301_t:CDS:2, partial [Dentiscutata heterogama]
MSQTLYKGALSYIHAFACSRTTSVRFLKRTYIKPSKLSGIFASNLTRNSMSESTYSKILTFETINPHIKNVEYAVRGELAIRAEEIKEELARNGSGKFGFNTVVNCNIGNPQQLLQRPITFFRQ